MSGERQGCAGASLAAGEMAVTGRALVRTAEPGDVPSTTGPGDTAAVTRPDDTAAVTRLLGRAPRGRFSVAVRDGDGAPVVIRNAPLLADGTPMPTLYWLVDPALSSAVGRLEAAGGVRAATGAVDPAALARAHRHYASVRDGLLPPGYAGPVPSGGVGGTRTGVKCLHAHLAWWLAGGDDPVGEWVAARLAVDRPLAG